MTPLFSPPTSAQTFSTVICGAETGRVYLREKPSAASQNANRTLKNGAPVETYDYQMGFFLVKIRQGLTGWVTGKYICLD